MSMNTQFDSHKLFSSRSPHHKFSVDTHLENFSSPEKTAIDFTRKRYKIPFDKLPSYEVCSLLAKQAFLQDPKGISENSWIPTETAVEVYKAGESKKTKRILGRVEKFFLKAFSKVFGESLRESLGIVSLKQRKEWHNNYAEELINGRVIESQKAMADYQFAKMEKDPFMMPMKVKESLFVEKKLLKVPSEISTIDLHKATARLAIMLESHVDIPNHFDLKLGKMEAYSFDGDIMRKGEGVVPTSYLLGDKEKVKIDNLPNVYVLDLGNGKAVIRSGRIDTVQRTKDFIKVIEDLSNKNPDKPLRVVSQQLNNFEAESKLIDGQHRQMIGANRTLGDKAELIHINIPSDRWVYVNKKVDSLGLLGNFIRALAPRKILKGERLSKKQNLDSWGTYVGWVATDLKGIQGIKTPLDKLNEDLLNYANLKRLVNNVITDPKPDMENLKLLRGALKDNLQLQYQQLGEMEKALKNVDSTSSAALQKVVLMRRILGVQLGIEKMNRSQEGMMIQLLNDKLGVVSALNCKSGLDRTGYWHAVKLAMLTQENIDSDRAFRMVTNWEPTTKLMHKIEALGPYHLHAYFNPKATWQTAKQEISHLLPPDLTEENFEEWRQSIEDVLIFRQEVLKNLIEIGIPITAASSGLMGFKWNSGMCENLLPLKFLPAYVSTEENGQTVTVPLIKYGPNGEILGMSRWGKRFITKFQKMRGS